jgi:oligopeptide/dipeptide ABC transporter ATP-binding protein
VEIGRTEEVLAAPSHPYTIGLLRSLPRLDRPRQAALTPIEGSPPDLASELAGCPFAPRCAWRVDASWTTGPQLVAARSARPEDDLRDQHRVACHNPPTAAEALEGRPLRPGVLPAPPPATGSVRT